MQVLQKLCPQGVETGLLNTSRQMEQEKLSSDQEVIAEAIPRHRPQGLRVEQRPYLSNPMRGRQVLTLSHSAAVLLTLL